MARIWMSGLEAGSLGVFSAVASAAEISSTQARTGTYSLRIPSTQDFAQADFSPVTEVFVRLGVYPMSLNGVGIFASILDSSGQPHVLFGVTDGEITYRLGSPTGALVTSGGTLPMDAWSCIETRVVVDDTEGVVQVKINGTLVIDQTNVDTRYGSYSKDIGGVRFGGQTGFTAFLNGYIDDIAINDTTGTINNSWIGQGGIYALTPNGAGTTTQLDPSAGANYTCVDDVPPDDDTSYVESDVQDEIDTYAMSASVGEGTISAVQWLAKAKANSAGTTAIARVLRVNGTDYVGSDIGIDTSYVYVNEILEVSPDDSAAWEPADLDALEAGLKVR